MAYGWASPILSYVFSFLGSLLALMLAIRARELSGRARVRPLLLSALVLGSTGIWLMHFVAMIGFDVPLLALRFDVVRTVFSLVLAVAVVAFGLLVVGLGRPTIPRILVGGVVTGLGVAGMHYAGMSAINMGGVITYDRELVVASVLIAVVAATVALFLAMVVRSASATVAAALAMALAVSSMHYTGMAAVRVTPLESVRNLPGVSPVTMLVPIAALGCLLLVGLFYSMAGVSVNAESDLRRSALPLRQPPPSEPPPAATGRRSARRSGSLASPTASAFTPGGPRRPAPGQSIPPRLTAGGPG